MRSPIIALLLVCFFPCKAFAQETAEAIIGRDTLSYRYHTSLNTPLPNRPLQLVISSGSSVAPPKPYMETLNSPRLYDDWHQVFLHVSGEMEPGQIRDFLDEIYYDYFFDKNRIHVFLPEGLPEGDPEAARVYLDFAASLWLPADTFAAESLDSERVFTIGRGGLEDVEESRKNPEITDVLTLREMRKLQEERQNYRSFRSLERVQMLSLSSGYYQVYGAHAAAFDEETLVDMAEIRALWTLSYSLMKTDKWGLVGELGFMGKRDATSETAQTTFGTTISGEGSGAGILKIGLGPRWVPYGRQRFHLYADLIGGVLNARIAGGTGNVAITGGGFSNNTRMVDKNQTSLYLDARVGATYRLGKRWMLLGNLQLTLSDFSEDMGSVSGMGGSGFNLGLGFVF